MPYKGDCALRLACSLHDQTFHACSITAHAPSFEEPEGLRKSLKIIEQSSRDIGMR